MTGPPRRHRDGRPRTVRSAGECWASAATEGARWRTARRNSDGEVERCSRGASRTVAERADATRRERPSGTARPSLEVALRRAVDVVDLEDAPLRLAGRILTERVVVTGHERVERVRWETAIYRPYVDVEYHAREMDRLVLQAMAEGRR